MLEVPGNLSGGGAPLKQSNHHDYNRQKEQNMNKSAQCERGKKADCPQETQYNRNCK